MYSKIAQNKLDKFIKKFDITYQDFSNDKRSDFHNLIETIFKEAYRCGYRECMADWHSNKDTNTDLTKDD